MRGRAVILLACGATLGCALVRPYDPPVPEAGHCADEIDQDFDGAIDCADTDCAAECDEATQCDDGEDDDVDGLTDCLDPQCLGTAACIEARAELCADGVDNDLDGRIDARDAGCWPFSRITTRRCASVLGSDVVLGPDAFLGGVPEVPPDGAELALRLPPTARTGATTVVSAAPVTGALDGVRATFAVRSLRAGTLSGGFSIALAEDGGGRSPGLVVSLLVTVSEARLFGVADTGDGLFERPFTLGPDPSRVEVSISIEGGIARATLRNALGTTIEVHGTLDPRFGEAVPILVAAGPNGGGTAWLEPATIHVPRLERCGGPQPPLGIAIDELGRERASTAIHDVVRGEDDELCALVTTRVRDGFELVSMRSRDDGVHWTRGAPILRARTGIAAMPDYAAVLARDPLTGRFHLARVESGDDVRAGVSDDCLTWATWLAIDSYAFDRAVTNYLYASPVDLAIDAEGQDLTLLVGSDGVPAFLHARSPWGEPGTWTIDDALELHPELGAAPTDDTAYVLLRRARLGAPVWLAGGARDVTVSSETGGVDTTIPELRRTPSREPGAFDAVDLPSPAVLLEDLRPADPRRWTGRLFHSGSYDLDVDTGWGWSEVIIEPLEAP